MSRMILARLRLRPETSPSAYRSNEAHKAVGPRGLPARAQARAKSTQTGQKDREIAAVGSAARRADRMKRRRLCLRCRFLEAIFGSMTYWNWLAQQIVNIVAT